VSKSNSKRRCELGGLGVRVHAKKVLCLRICSTRQISSDVDEDPFPKSGFCPIMTKWGGAVVMLNNIKKNKLSIFIYFWFCLLKPTAVLGKGTFPWWERTPLSQAKFHHNFNIAHNFQKLF
jgi:hypothetical protein